MKNKDLIKKLQKMNPEGTVWISDEQGRYTTDIGARQNQEEIDTDMAETVEAGDIVISFENT